MQSIKIPPDATSRPIYGPFLAAGAQPGESVVLDDDGAVCVVRYPNDVQAQRLAAALFDAALAEVQR